MAMRVKYINKATKEVAHVEEQGKDTFNDFRDRNFEVSKQYPSDKFEMVHDNS